MADEVTITVSEMSVLCPPDENDDSVSVKITASLEDFSDEPWLYIDGECVIQMRYAGYLAAAIADFKKAWESGE